MEYHEVRGVKKKDKNNLKYFQLHILEKHPDKFKNKNIFKIG